MNYNSVSLRLNPWEGWIDLVLKRSSGRCFPQRLCTIQVLKDKHSRREQTCGCELGELILFSRGLCFGNERGPRGLEKKKCRYLMCFLIKEVNTSETL